MTKKSAFKKLGVAGEQIVGVPSVLDSIIVSNRSANAVRANLSIRRGSQTYAIFGDEVPPGRSASVLGGKDSRISIVGADSLEGSASAGDALDVSCSYEETAGPRALFDPRSWNQRSSWAVARGTTAGSFNPPQFVLDGLNAGASRWRNSCCFQAWVHDAIADILPGWSGLELENYTEINADNGYLAACGVNLYVEDGTLLNAVSFDLQVNRFYATELTQDEWNDVMTHEMGHGLGIGIFWTASSFFLSGSSYPSVQNAYNSISLLDRNKTPLESSGGSGTASAHWEDDYRLSEGVPYYGVADELMVGALVPGGMVLSDLSIGALKDFAYETYPSQEGTPSLATSTPMAAQKRVLKCGLSSMNPDKMMGMLRPSLVATKGKLNLRRYIMS